MDDRQKIRNRIKQTNAERDRAQAIRDNLSKVEETKRQAAEKAKSQVAFARDTERKRLAAEAEKAACPRKILACGDTLGNFAKLFGTAGAQAGKVGPFDALLCVGAFLPDTGGNEMNSNAYLGGGMPLPVETYFVDTNVALLQAASGGMKVCDNLHFLGGYGIREISGLRVAFLSGNYDPAVYDTTDADFVGSAFTQKAVNELRRLVVEDKKQRGIDMLLTCGWPADIDQKIQDESSRPAELADGRPWQLACAQPLADLCLAIEPRYHIFGTADLFYQRPPFQVPQQGHISRCIGLGKVGSTSKQRKWLHAFSLSPMSQMKRDDLNQLPSNATPCPFTAGRKRSAPDLPAAPASKRCAISQVSPDKNLPGQAVAALIAGDFQTYQRLVATLQNGVNTCGSAITEAMLSRAPIQKALPTASTTTSKDDEPHSANAATVSSATSSGAGTTEVPKEAAKPAEVPILSEEEQARKEAAAAWLERGPIKGVVRYTFQKEGPLGLRFSKDIPPWILEVRDGSLSAQKAPRVPVGGIVLAVNGYELTEKDCQVAVQALPKRPVILDVAWPQDQGIPTCNRA